MNSSLQRGLKTVAGFTLIELLVSMAVASILLGVAVPSLQEAVRDGRLSQVIGPARMALNTARSEAVKAARKVTVCPLATNRSCGTDWNDGLLVFVDNRVVFNETVAVRDAQDVILRVEETDAGNVTLTVFASDNRTAAGLYAPAFIRFGSNGQSNWLNGSLVACDERGVESAQVLNVTLSGEVQTARLAEGVLEDAFGRPVTCP